MKRIIFIMLFLVGTRICYSQNQQITLEDCQKWNTLKPLDGQNSIISNDGKYVVYQFGSDKTENTIVLKPIFYDSEKRFTGGRQPTFTTDSKLFLVLLPGDTLLIRSLDTKASERYITNVKFYQTFKAGDKQWLLYQLKNGNKLVLTEFSSNNSVEFNQTIFFKISASNRYILLKYKTGLVIHDLLKNTNQNIQHSQDAINAIFDPNDRLISFMINRESLFEIKLFQIQTGVIFNIIDTTATKSLSNLRITDQPLSFNVDGEVVYYSAKTKETSVKNDELLKSKAVNVWSYKDVTLQSHQLAQLAINKSIDYEMAVNLKNGKIIQIENDSLKVLQKGNKYILLGNKLKSQDEFYWNNEKQTLYLLSLEDGKRSIITQNLRYPGYKFAIISPDDQYVVWFDPLKAQYYSFETKSGIVKNISDGITESLLFSKRGETDKPRDRVAFYWIAGFMPENNSIIVNTANDIWQLDLAGKNKPCNLTNGYGARSNITFRLLNRSNNSFLATKDNCLIITGFNNDNKQNGFWKIRVGIKQNPQKLIMDSHAWSFTPTAPFIVSSPLEDVSSYNPIKAKDCDVFIVRKMSSSESPNLFYTYDFIKYYTISNIHPENDYIKVKSDLIKWTLPDGLPCQGILHKPENFDESKKYPVIFNYYERRSDGLNFYHTPSLAGHNINIAWYVSRGYLIFEPDFYYKTGEVANCIVETVKSAANKLASIPYVDTSRMGCQGHSFGGYETNVIATGTNIFKAACEVAGTSDIIREWTSLGKDGTIYAVSSDIGQRNLAVLPWEYPEVFTRNSPFFNIGKMKTSLLIVHNQSDDSILYPQAIELYLGMRRAGKKVWMLEYDKEGHAIYDDINKLDFTIRMQQFFDHYLKDAPPPKWMTEGIAAKDKGIASGLELDTSGKQP